MIRLSDLYREHGRRLTPGDMDLQAGITGWRSPSNIALVKYWGKVGEQMPINPSVSFSLSESYTETTVEFGVTDDPRIVFSFGGSLSESFGSRVEAYIGRVSEYLPFLGALSLRIDSSNSFPHSAGIASSASAMSALAMCLCSIERNLFGTLQDDTAFKRKASFLARLGSGSASRSLFPGFAVWGHHPGVPGSSDEVAQPLPFRGLRLRDTILITDSGEKPVSSSAGHRLMERHPYREARIAQAFDHTLKLTGAIRDRDMHTLVRVVEQEALTLHGLMMSSDPGYGLLNDRTWAIIREVRRFREQSGIPVCFTLDAGPNVHLVYPDDHQAETAEWIDERLLQHCEEGRRIDDGMGRGPEEIRKTGPQ
ncbi:MAG: hypothetical protein JW861_08290 [Bacteroidales bacterium]|nr:hypothetical protein [Bacteroidales bacterium]